MLKHVYLVRMCAGSCVCLHDALTFHGTGYRGTDFIEGFSFWPDYFARVFLGYLLYDLVIMLAFRQASASPARSNTRTLSVWFCAAGTVTLTPEYWQCRISLAREAVLRQNSSWARPAVTLFLARALAVSGICDLPCPLPCTTCAT